MNFPRLLEDDDARRWCVRDALLVRPADATRDDWRVLVLHGELTLHSLLKQRLYSMMILVRKNHFPILDSLHIYKLVYTELIIQMCKMLRYLENLQIFDTQTKTLTQNRGSDVFDERFCDPKPIVWRKLWDIASNLSNIVAAMEGVFDEVKEHTIKQIIIYMAQRVFDIVTEESCNFSLWLKLDRRVLYDKRTPGGVRLASTIVYSMTPHECNPISHVRQRLLRHLCISNDKLNKDDICVICCDDTPTCELDGDDRSRLVGDNDRLPLKSKCWYLLQKRGGKDFAVPLARQSMDDCRVVFRRAQQRCCTDEQQIAVVDDRADVCDFTRIALPCGHVFHACCIWRWYQRSPTCPCCKCLVPRLY